MIGQFLKNCIIWEGTVIQQVSEPFSSYLITLFCIPLSQRNFSYISVYYGEDWQRMNMHCNLTRHKQLNWLGLRHIDTTEKYRPVEEWEPCKFARGNYAFIDRYGPVVFGELGSQRTIAIQQNVCFQRNLLNLVLGPLFVWPVIDYYAFKQLKHLQTMRIAKSVSEWKSQ